MKHLKVTGAILTLLLVVLTVESCLINNPKPEECEVVTATIVSIKEATSFDIMLYDNNGDYFYINRGLEQGLTLESLKNKLLNKEATMHLPKFVIGTSEHIAQLVVDGSVLYTEFN